MYIITKACLLVKLWLLNAGLWPCNLGSENLAQVAAETAIAIVATEELGMCPSIIPGLSRAYSELMPSLCRAYAELHLLLNT